MAKGQTSGNVGDSEWETVTPNKAAKNDDGWETVSGPKAETTPQSTSKPLSQTTLGDIGDIGIGFGKGLLETGEGFGNLMTFGAERRMQTPEQRKKFQETVEPKGDYQSAGKITEQIGTMIAPIPGLGKIKAAANAGKLAKTAVGAARGAIDVGLRTGSQTGEWKDAATGAAVGAAGEAIAPLAAKGLKSAARSQYGKLLHPLGRKAKEATEAKLLTGKADDLIGQGYKKATALTKESLLKKFSEESTKAGRRVDETYNNLPPSARVNLTPVVNDLTAYVNKNAMLPSGKIVNQELYDRVSYWANKMVNDLGGSLTDARPSDVRRFRQIIDKDLKYAQQHGRINPNGSDDMAKEAMVNSIREHLHRQHPNISEVDKSFNLWETARKMLAADHTADVGKYHMASKWGAAAKGIPMAVLGEETGRKEGGLKGGVAGGLAGAALGTALTSAFESTAWRSVSAVTKDKIADLIVAGNTKAAAGLATRAVSIGATKAISSGVPSMPSVVPMPATASVEPTSGPPMGSEFVPAPMPEPQQSEVASSYSDEEDPQ